MNQGQSAGVGLIRQVRRRSGNVWSGCFFLPTKCKFKDEVETGLRCL